MRHCTHRGDAFYFNFCLVFTGKNLFRDLQADPAGNEIGKDTVYRFLNSVNANWRKFLHLLSAAVIRKQILPLTSEQTPKVFIVDDSLYNRNRSKKVELLARVHDHNENRYYCGFRLLTLGWSDGSTCVPVSFSLLSSAKEFQSRGYDALVAHTTIVFASYIMLEFKDGPAIMQRWLDRRSGRSPGAGCGPAVARASSAAGFFHNRSLAGIPSSDGHSTVRRPVSSRRIDWIPVRGTTAMAIAAFSSTGRADRVSMARISTAPPARVTLAIRVRL